jgi:predicted AAA+ superfamily ATPase
MIQRTQLHQQVERALGRSRVVVLTGPRQSGKTTLARQFLDEDSPNYFDLEDPASLARLEEPMTALRPLSGLVVIDEIQRRPGLFPVLRVLADRSTTPARFLILGSASGDLLRQNAESLAGRSEQVELDGFSLEELGAEQEFPLWFRGGFPPSLLAANDEDSLVWRRNFIRTLLERDLPAWGVGTPATTLLRFWTLLAHYHGQTWNTAEAARSLGVSESSARRHLDLLTDALLVRQLQPHLANLHKRQVKSPKVYIRDSGLLHALLGIGSTKELLTHPRHGASWEGFVIEQVIRREPHDEAHFWGSHQGAEIDLVIRSGSRLLGVECKRQDAPRATVSMYTALEELGLERIAVIHPGIRRYPLADRVEAVPLSALATDSPLFT